MKRPFYNLDWIGWRFSLNCTSIQPVLGCNQGWIATQSRLYKQPSCINGSIWSQHDGATEAKLCRPRPSQAFPEKPWQPAASLNTQISFVLKIEKIHCIFMQLDRNGRQILCLAEMVATTACTLKTGVVIKCHTDIQLTDTHQRLSEKLRECRKGADGEVVLTA